MSNRDLWTYPALTPNKKYTDTVLYIFITFQSINEQYNAWNTMTEELFKLWDHVLSALKDASMDKTQCDMYTMIQSLNKELTMWLLWVSRAHIFYKYLLRPSRTSVSNQKNTMQKPHSLKLPFNLSLRQIYFKALCLYLSVYLSLLWCIAIDAKCYQSKNVFSATKTWFCCYISL